MRIQYQKELELLHQELAQLGGLCADAIGETYQALRSGASDIYRAAKERGDQIRDLERTAEGRCIQLLLLQQPVASDLRRVSSALKMTTDLGRIGDNTVDIAEILRYRTSLNPLRRDHIIAMAEKAAVMVKDSVNAYIGNDAETARNVIRADDEVDRLFETVRDELADGIRADRTERQDIMDELMIAKYYERMADHAVNVAQWAIYAATGEHAAQE